MTVRASMDVDIYDVSIHDWANNAYGTPSCLPLCAHHALPAPIPVPSHSPDRSPTPEGNIQHLHLQESVAVAAPREESSFYLQAPPQEEEAKRALANGMDHQNKTQDLPCPNRGLHLNSWLSS